MIETLAYVDVQGGGKIYDLFFSLNSDSVWGENWNVCPAAIIPNITVDIQSCSSIIRISLPKKISLAKTNTCFSMQDCIDGIIPLGYADINNDPLMDGGNPFIIRFGEEKEEIIKRIKRFGGEILLETNLHNSADDMMDDLIDSIDDKDI